MNRERTELNRIREERLVYEHLQALTGHFICVYVVNLDTDEYREFSATDDYTEKLHQAKEGTNFFGTVRKAAQDVNHPEDLDRFLTAFTKENVLEEIERHGVFTLVYRLMIEDKPLHVQMNAVMMTEEEGPRLIVGLNDVDVIYRQKEKEKADQQKSVTYTQIAERLADHFDLIYYIDCKTLKYAELSTKKKSGELKVQAEGEDFFEAAMNNVDRLIYSEDRERIRQFMDRDFLISQLEDRRQVSADYRMVAGNGKTQYTRMSVTYSSDHSHFIICVENRDRDVRREQEHLAALNMANEIARRDELTHVKNTTAYHEKEKELEKQIREGTASFGIMVCDINGLKVVNDTEGHRAGDEFIKDCCMLVCRVFHHSPVFRIGGDEFVVILQGQDFERREELTENLRRQVEEHIRMGEGAVVASGLAMFRKGEDHSVEDVFNRADSEMYGNKTYLREMKLLQESRTLKERKNIPMISEERRNKLDSLFRSFEVVAEGTYVYLCDMKYDFSRWSKNAVDAFGLPSEYMYAAGDIWEERIHPEDRAAYHKGIDDIFSGNAAGHDMQYRAKRLNGEYDVCTCRGTVIRDPSGEPDYFAGTIRNHGLQGHIDTLTGMRNQYGFFEDLDSCIRRNTRISVVLIGISKFSEINEIYGYHYGNRVLQQYARELFTITGNTGHTYRIDGTKFAVISNTLTVEELQEKYKAFRAFLHENFKVEGRNLLLDLNCGALRVDSSDIDSQTVYGCLNFAYEESKNLRKGDLVEFRNDLNAQNHRRLEMLHAIRASVMHGHEGFYLLYQPVVDAKTEQLTGAEALLRWRNDEYGMVPPDLFIPVLEADPLFPELGEWILREAVVTAKKILAQHPGFVVNVNLSYSQVEKPDFTDMVTRILQETEYPPEHLCLEVTERCRLLDMELLKNAVANLKSRGILVALDDFGTGFSSVGLLKEIPIDVIKIDRSFVQAIETNEIDRKLVQNVIELASVFNSKVCVEGIETPGMRDMLREFGAGSFQGYYYSKPLPPEQVMEWKK